MVSIDSSVCINISATLTLHRRRCGWYKYVKVHQDDLLEGKSPASDHVNINHANNYFLLNFNDDQIAFVDAATGDDY